MTHPAAVKEANKLCGYSFTSGAIDKWKKRNSAPDYMTWFEVIWARALRSDDGLTLLKRVKRSGRELLADLDTAPHPVPFGT
jgi:hypothetical protein